MKSGQAEQEAKLEKKEVVTEQAELEADAKQVQPGQADLQAKLEHKEVICI